MASTPSNRLKKNTNLHINLINPNVTFYLRVIRTKIMYNAIVNRKPVLFSIKNDYNNRICFKLN
jgi:hypothetical protein